MEDQQQPQPPENPSFWDRLRARLGGVDIDKEIQDIDKAVTTGQNVVQVPAPRRRDVLARLRR